MPSSSENLDAIAPVHLRDTDAEFGRERPRERVLHDSVKMGHVAKVVRHTIEVDDAPIHALILRHDVEVRLVEQFRAMPRAAVLHVGLTFRLKDIPRHPQADDAVDGASAVGVLAGCPASPSRRSRGIEPPLIERA